MRGRKLLAVAVLVVGGAFGGGVAVAAGHGSAHPASKAPHFTPTSNVHYPCRKHGSPTNLL